MSYVSAQYLLFVGIVFILYYTIPKKWQWSFLLICSYGFYLFAGIKPLFFILFTTISTYLAGLKMGEYEKEYRSYLDAHRDELTREEKKARKADCAARKKKILLAALLSNFGILFVLKYYNPIASNISQLFSLFKYDASLPLINVILPLGISFYMFMSLSYCIDVYRAKYEPETNIFKFALFISFFPSVVQGPLSRYDQLGSQLTAEHDFNIDNLRRGLLLMGWGFMKKIVIADRAAIVVKEVFANYSNFDGFQVAAAIFVYTMQIYCDFSGGIDITRGVAQVMGIDLIENFQRPYFAISVPDYWGRWHMSLTAWMREYVFYPMTLSKKMIKLGSWSRAHLKGRMAKQLPSYCVTFTVFFLMGIWHGAALGNFAFALYNGGVIVLGMICKPLFDKLAGLLHVNEKSFLFHVWQIIRTYFVMLIGKMMVKATSVGAGFKMLWMSFTDFHPFHNTFKRLIAMGMGGSDWIALTMAILILFVVSLLQENGINIRDKIESKPLAARWTFYLIALTFLLVFGTYGPGYSASEFIYRNY